MELHTPTLAFEIVNFLALVWLMERFVYRPVAAAIAKRRRHLAAVEHDARQLADRARAREQEVALEVGDLDALRERITADARASALAERARLLEDARDAAAARAARAEELLVAERRAVAAALREEVLEQGTRLAGRLVHELAPEATHHALVARLVRELAALDATALSVPSRSARAVCTTAAPLSPQEHAALFDALQQAVGRSADLAVHEDPALRGGARLELDELVLDATLAGQLGLLRGSAAAQLVAAGEEAWS